MFGIRTKTAESEYMLRLFSLMNEWSEVLELGATPPIDSFPLLKLVPERLLGSWKSRATRVGELMMDLYSEILDQVQQRRRAGFDRGSFMDRVLDANEKNRLSPSQLQFLGGVLMEGGSDTSSSLILAMIRALLEFPDVQRRFVLIFSPVTLPLATSQFPSAFKVKRTKRFSSNFPAC